MFSDVEKRRLRLGSQPVPSLTLLPSFLPPSLRGLADLWEGQFRKGGNRTRPVMLQGSRLPEGSADQPLTSTSFPIPLKLVSSGTARTRQKEKCQMTFVACVPIVSDTSFLENISLFSPWS